MKPCTSVEAGSATTPLPPRWGLVGLRVTSAPDIWLGTGYETSSGQGETKEVCGRGSTPLYLMRSASEAETSPAAILLSHLRVKTNTPRKAEPGGGKSLVLCPYQILAANRRKWVVQVNLLYCEVIHVPKTQVSFCCLQKLRLPWWFSG